MAKHTSKKLLTGIFALSAAFILAGCDTINALPTNYESPIVQRNPATKNTLTDNQLGKIWEAISSGKTEKIHDEIIYQISADQLGYYFSQKDGNGVIIEDYRGIADITTDDQIKAFIAKHEAVFAPKSDEKLASRDEIYTKVRKPRFVNFKADMQKRIAEKLYGEITNANFNDKEGRFHEIKFALDLYFGGYDIKGITFVNGVAQDDASWFKLFITSTIDKYDLSSITSKAVHIERFEDYVQKKIVRDIYKEKLVEQYIFEQNYSVLGKAYARNINYVSLKYDDINKEFANALIKKAAQDYVVNSTESFPADLVADTFRGIKNLTFTDDGKIATIEVNPSAIAVPGYAKTTVRELLAAEMKTIDVGGTPTEVRAYTDAEIDDLDDAVILDFEFYKESNVGKIFVKYEKALRAVLDKHTASTKDTNELNEFTGTDEHSRSKGLRDKLTALVLEDYTDNGWGLKNGGFSSLPSAISSDRLFNINVANAVDNFVGANAAYKESTGHMGNYATSGAFSYVRCINERYFLNKANAQKYEDDPYSYIFNEDSSYTIVQVNEAVSSSKLKDKESEGSYGNLGKDVYFTEQTAREIAKLLGTKDSYQSSAYENYLKKYDLKFNDQEVYDYFVTTYPDTYGED